MRDKIREILRDNCESRLGHNKNGKTIEEKGKWIDIIKTTRELTKLFTISEEKVLKIVKFEYYEGMNGGYGNTDIVKYIAKAIAKGDIYK